MTLYNVLGASKARNEHVHASSKCISEGVRPAIRQYRYLMHSIPVWHPIRFFKTENAICDKTQLHAMPFFIYQVSFFEDEGGRQKSVYANGKTMVAMVDRPNVPFSPGKNKGRGL